MKRILFKVICVAILGMVAETLQGQVLATVDKSHLNTQEILRGDVERLKEGMAKKYVSYIYYDWTNQVRNVSGFIDKGFKVDLRGFVMPTKHKTITSNFGKRWGRMHEGTDIKVYIGDTIVSAFSGKVRVVGYDRNGWGYYVLVRHYNGLETLYAHLSKHIVKEGDIVKAGETIGLGGSTGRSTGSHLHFEVRLLGKPINPLEIFDFANQDVKMDYYIVKAD